MSELPMTSTIESISRTIRDLQALLTSAEDYVERLEYELTEAESASWRVRPNTYTVPCELNNYAEPDPFEGPGESWRDAYERVQKELTEARRRLTWYRERVVWMHLEEGAPRFFQGPEGEHEINEPVDTEFVIQLFQRAYSDKNLSK